MPLTEEQKRKIEEEEYRKSVQGGQQNRHTTEISNPRVGKNLMVVGMVLLFIAFFLFAKTVSSEGGSGASGGFAMAFFIVGLGLIIYGKAKHWYHWK